MKRRDFFKGILLSGSLSLAGPGHTARPQGSQHTKIIDAHCHAGRGINYTANDPKSDPWTTYNDPAWTLRRARQANLHLDTSSVVFFEYLERAASELPPQKLIFGSDGLLVNSQVEFYKIRLLELPKEKEQLILGGNITRLLNR